MHQRGVTTRAPSPRERTADAETSSVIPPHERAVPLVSPDAPGIPDLATLHRAYWRAATVRPHMKRPAPLPGPALDPQANHQGLSKLWQM